MRRDLLRNDLLLVQDGDLFIYYVAQFHTCTQTISNNQWNEELIKYDCRRSMDVSGNVSSFVVSRSRLCNSFTKSS